MHLSCRLTHMLLQASEEVGVSRERIAEGTRLDVARLGDPRGTTDWTTLVALVNRIYELVDHDPVRMRDIGRRMARAPAWGAVRAVGRNLLSPRALYEFTFRWVAPASFPLLVPNLEFTSGRHMRIRAEIPTLYPPCEGFFHLSQGCIVALSQAVGHGAVGVVESHVTARTFDLTLVLPPSRSMLARVTRRVRAAVESEETLATLEAQREQLAEAMASLLRASDELRIVLDRIPDLVIVHREGTVVWGNRAVLRTLGIPGLEDLVGRDILELVAERSRDEVRARIAQPAARSAEGLELLEIWMRRLDGTEVLCEATPAQEVVFDGARSRLVVGRDMTDRIAMQQRLVTADRLSSVGLLAAGVAHEMNNPLTYVLVNIEMARKDVATFGAPAGRAREALTTALEGVARMRTIVRDLLVLSRGEKVMAVPTDVAAVVDSTLALAGEEIRRKARLERARHPGPLASASDARIAQILLNLVSNALQALPERPVGENVIDVETGRTEDGRVLLEVRDNGPGIPPEHLSRVFEPFFTTKTDGLRTGLGLPITQRLVVELGGEISVRARASGGTAVRVVLPAAEGPESAPPRPPIQT